MYCLHNLYTLLSPLAASAEQLAGDAVELEYVVHSLANRHTSTYTYGMLRAMSLLRKGRLQALRHEEAAPRAYASILRLPASDLYPDLPCVRQSAEADALREQGEALLRDLGSEDLNHIPDAGIRCARCKSSDIAFDFLQTRSADEGTTVYCTCTKCSKRWKM